MSHFSIVLVLLTLPLLGAVFLLFIRGDEKVVSNNSYHVSLLITASTFLTACAAGMMLGAHKTDDFNISLFHAPSLKISAFIGLDALSLFFVLLISFLSVMSVFVSRKNIQTMNREYMFLTLILESFLLFAVCMRDLFLFYVSFEAAVIPLFLLIALWGVEKRALTPFRFCLFEIVGSVFLLAGIFLIYHRAGSSDFSVLPKIIFQPQEQKLILYMFIGAIAFKAPLFPFHAWLTDALSEAPPAAGVMISGAFTKVIFYAFVRFVIPIAGNEMIPLIMGLSIWALISAMYGSMVALVQDDVRKMAGFSHLTQTGLLALGLFTLTPESLQGTLFLTAVQAMSMSAFLLACGALYQRFGYTQNMTGVLSKYPYLGAVFFLSGLAMLAFPPMPAFTGQFLIFQAAFSEHAAFAAVGLLSVMLLYASFFKHFGKMLFRSDEAQTTIIGDLRWREKTAAVLLGTVFLYLALTPAAVFRLTSAAVAPLFK